MNVTRRQFLRGAPIAVIALSLFPLWILKLFKRDQWANIKEPQFPDGTLLLGHKDARPVEAGYIWAPYTVTYDNDLAIFDENFVATKMGSKTINSEYYGTLKLL